MKKGLYTIIAVWMAALLMITSTSSAVSALTTLTGDDVIDIKDSYFLQQLIGYKIDLNNDGKISVKEMESLDNLYINNYDAPVTDISGIEYAKNLVYLNLYGVNVSDLSFVRNMSNLKSLSISNLNNTSSSLSDISALEGLTGLTSLSISNGSISDISLLKNLTQLNTLSLRNNKISDISILKNLTELRSIYLEGNSISDISALKYLDKLGFAFLNNNLISDLSALKDLPCLSNLYLNSNAITDVSPLSGLLNLYTLQLENNKISNIIPLKNLSSLSNLSLSGNNISDSDRIEVARLTFGEMFKGRQYYFNVMPNGILSDYTVSSENKDIVSIENFHVTALKEGEATIKLQYGGLSKLFNMQVKGIDAAQPLETSETVTAEFTSNAALNSKGELWNLADNGSNIVMSGVKKYVANAVYEGESGNRSDLSNSLAIDSSSNLWSWGQDKQNENGTMSFQNKKQEMSNVQYVDTRYAVTNNNELWDYYADQGKLLDNVKQIKRIISSSSEKEYNIGTEVLKSDNTLWVRRDVKLGDTTKVLVQVDTGVRELTDSNGYIKNDGTYWQWDGVATGNIVFKKITDNVKVVNQGLIVKTDGNVLLPDGSKTLLTTGLKDIKSDDDYNRTYLVDNNNTLWFYNGFEILKISDGFKEFTESGFIKSDGKIYDYSNVEVNYVNKINSNYEDIGDITLGKDNILYISDIKILTDVKKIYRTTNYSPSYYAIRTDGSIWEVGDMIPTKLINVDYDVTHDGVIDIFDMADIGSRYNSISTATKYNKECDFNKDNIIDIYDVVSFSKKLRW